MPQLKATKELIFPCTIPITKIKRHNSKKVQAAQGGCDVVIRLVNPARQYQRVKDQGLQWHNAMYFAVHYYNI